MLSKLFAYIGVHPEAVQATVQAFVRSFWYTLTGVLSGMLLLMLAQGAFNSFDDTLTWLAKYGWPFIVANAIVPSLRAHAAANLLSPGASVALVDGHTSS